MSTLQNPLQHRDRIRTRLGAGILALSTLSAIGLALLILIPTSHRTTTPTTSRIATQVALAAQAPAPAGCFRDPATHALTCSHARPAPIATATPAGYFRDPITHKLLRIPAARKRAEHHPPNHSRGRIIP
jgi:hypothetical protein